MFTDKIRQTAKREWVRRWRERDRASDQPRNNCESSKEVVSEKEQDRERRAAQIID